MRGISLGLGWQILWVEDCVIYQAALSEKRTLLTEF